MSFDISNITIASVVDELLEMMDRKDAHEADCSWRGCKIEGDVYDITLILKRSEEDN